jgi:hypothetical protein
MLQPEKYKLMTDKKVYCNKCVHYYVTWDNKAPRGCRAMGFKSKSMPSLVVFKSSGVQCLKFKPKKG